MIPKSGICHEQCTKNQRGSCQPVGARKRYPRRPPYGDEQLQKQPSDSGVLFFLPRMLFFGHPFFAILRRRRRRMRIPPGKGKVVVRVVRPVLSSVSQERRLGLFLQYTGQGRGVPVLRRGWRGQNFRRCWRAIVVVLMEGFDGGGFEREESVAAVVLVVRCSCERTLGKLRHELQQRSDGLGRG